MCMKVIVVVSIFFYRLYDEILTIIDELLSPVYECDWFRPPVNVKRWYTVAVIGLEKDHHKLLYLSQMPMVGIQQVSTKWNEFLAQKPPWIFSVRDRSVHYFDLANFLDFVLDQDRLDVTGRCWNHFVGEYGEIAQIWW